MNEKILFQVVGPTVVSVILAKLVYEKILEKEAKKEQSDYEQLKSDINQFKKRHMRLEYEKLLKKEAIQFDKLPLDIVTRINNMNFDIKNLRKEYKHAPTILKRELRVKNKIDLGICKAIQDWIKVQPLRDKPEIKASEQLLPDHYKAGNMDVISFCHHHDISFCRGNIIKYVTRAGKKKSDNPLKEIEDLKKAKVYLDREIAKLEEEDNQISNLKKA